MAPSHLPPVANKLPIARELQFAAEAGLSLSQVNPYGDAPLPSLELAFNYVPGMPMVPSPEVENNLPTRLRLLHDWYMRAAKRGQTQFMFCAGREHFLGEAPDYPVSIDFGELFRFFNLRDIDVALVSAHTL